MRDTNTTIPPTPATDPRATYTTDEAAARAGVHPDTLRSAAARGEFPAPLRVGSKFLWPRAAVEAFLAGAGIRTATATPAARTAATR